MTISPSAVTVKRTSPVKHILEENKKKKGRKEERERNSKYKSASVLYLKTRYEKQVPAT
jgi:hypothetical protein